ncbi:hypothetical protein SAMN00790413_01366 [Deinococcus hopiensis KR-140]|uniref:Uncharacterized protein n=1 Tax=Deinococcus hopiensis KR-140 TaxID=695939 RepID=A0A1W1VEY0_9DEIO|nr:hypothetical protein SAMN00790413_01366 [Deinococcus hopiensis KR-140]
MRGEEKVPPGKPGPFPPSAPPTVNVEGEEPRTRSSPCFFGVGQEPTSPLVGAAISRKGEGYGGTGRARRVSVPSARPALMLGPSTRAGRAILQGCPAIL